jgi:hypothetical protein
MMLICRQTNHVTRNLRMEADDVLLVIYDDQQDDQDKNNHNSKTIILLLPQNEKGGGCNKTPTVLLKEYNLILPQYERQKDNYAPITVHQFKISGQTDEGHLSHARQANLVIDNVRHMLNNHTERATLETLGVTKQNTVAFDRSAAFTSDMSRSLTVEEVRSILNIPVETPAIPVIVSTSRSTDAQPLKSGTTTPYRLPAMVANALVMALSGGMLITCIVSSGGPITMLGLGIAGGFASCIALFSLLINVRTGCQANSSWTLTNKAQFSANICFKSVCAALALVSALGSFGIIPLGTLLPILLPAFMIVSMIGAMVMDSKVQLEMVEQSENTNNNAV